MMEHIRAKATRSLVPLCLTAAVCLIAASTARAVDSQRLRNTFDRPPREYASAPLWVWNDRLTEEQIAGTMRDLAGQGVKQVFVHPRPGLMTPYLSDEWFKLWKIALREAERLDMNVWIYDENSYPSGFAGGLVPKAMPESRGMGLVIEEKDAPIKLDKDTVAVLQSAANGYQNITSLVKDFDELTSPGKYLVASLRWAGTSPWYGGTFYVNLLTPGVTEKFLELTMEPYVKNIGSQFGDRVPGVFTDEPHLAPAGGLPWSKDLPEVFKKRWGYDLIDSLPSLVRPVGDWRRVRHNYLQVLLDLFIERWAKPYHDYCEKHGLEFTGHYWEHEWPNCTMAPDNMAMYAWHQRPAIDNLMNQHSEDVHGQFGNTRTVKELSSVANQMGMERTLCEAYGAGGWDLRFEDMKRIGDWLYVLGVNTLDEHLSYITIRGARKRDHPQSFSYHEPWWKHYHVMANYFTRLSMVLSAGKQVNRILVLEPTTSVWMYQGDGGKLNEIGNGFQKFVMDLEREQVEYDLGCEDIMTRHGSVEGSRLTVGQRSYDVVVLPPFTENLNSKTMDLLAAYVQAGGKVLCCGEAPQYVDGSASDRSQAAAKSTGWKRVEAAEVPQMLAAEVKAKDGFAIERVNCNEGILYHHRRVVEDGEFLLLVNTSIDASSSGWITAETGGVEQWNLHTAEVCAYPFEKTDAGMKAAFDLPPCGSLLLFLSKKAKTPQTPKAPRHTYVTVQGNVEVAPLDENVLTLDFVDVAAGGESKKNVYFYAANRFAFAKNGMPQNPWDSSVQFKDELITKTFPAGSGVEASYRFTIEDRVPERLSIVIERPDLYEVTCNGKPVSAAQGQWWLDKSFGRIEIAQNVKTGENVVTIQASPFTIYHELEPAYLLGSFKLKAGPSGFAVVGQSKPAMELGSWKGQGYPFYAAGVSYSEKFDIARPAAGQYLVELSKWYGSVAEVLVNGQPAGCIVSRPWTCDVTKALKPGSNTIEVRVIGTLKNTLGPHHNGTGLGSAWPGSFQRGPETGPPAGEQYHTVDYGLFEPFVLRQIVTE